MSPDERIAFLEQEVLRLRSGFAELRTVTREALAEQNMLYAAVIALIESSQVPDKLGPILRKELAQVDSVAVFQAQEEEQIQAGQDAQNDLLTAIGKAESAQP